MVTQRRTSTRWLRPSIIALTLITTLIHMSLLFPDPVFLLNGLGYLALLGALYLPIPALAGRRGLIRRVLIAYTALAVMLWLAFGSRIPIAYVDKVVEVVLIGLLLLDDRRDR